MEAKFKRSINSFKYLVMFDLASKITGVCLWDIKNHKSVKTDIISTADENGNKDFILFNKLKKYFAELSDSGISLEDIIVYKEAMPIQVHGGNSTVKTFVALARSHAILDLFIDLNNLWCYDYTGVYPVSTHSYLRKIKNLTTKDPIKKQDILEYVTEKYKIQSISFDESDAIFLAQTFVDVKWDKDIDEQIRDVKRHIKQLKLKRAIDDATSEIERLKGLKINQ